MKNQTKNQTKSQTKKVEKSDQIHPKCRKIRPNSDQKVKKAKLQREAYQGEKGHFYMQGRNRRRFRNFFDFSEKLSLKNAIKIKNLGVWG